MKSRVHARQASTSTLKTALAHHRGGRLAEASACYSIILRDDPTNADALNLTGVLARQRGDLSISERLIQRAIQQKASVATYHHNLGRTFALQGRTEEASRSYRRAIELNADDADSMQMLAPLLVSAGNTEEAEGFYKRLLRLRPNQVEIYFSLGLLLKVRGEVNLALSYYEQAAGLFPKNADAHFNLAKTLYEDKQLEEAAQSYRQVLLIHPEDAETHNCLGRVLHELSKADEAKHAYLSALQFKADFPEAMSNLGALLMDVGELALGETFLRKAIELAPDMLNAHCNLGSILGRQGNALGAIQSLRKVLVIDPAHAEALCTLGFVLDTLGDETDAATCFRLALQARPDFPLARFNLSSHLLAAGNFVEGWREYEMRWQVRQFAGSPRSYVQPQWRGENVQGFCVYVFAEQGFGDTIQFLRYALLLVDLGAEVILEVQPLLFNLLRGSHPSIQVVLKDENVASGFDWHCPLLSLPGVFGTEIDNIPAKIPYLHARTALEPWAARMAGTGFKIGIVWSGNPSHTRDRLRSISFTQFCRIVQVPDTIFYSLQKGPAAAQIAESPLGEQVIDLDPELLDFTDTAAAMANLDLVIAVDTAVAHLAAAVGRPVWLLLHHAPDWRWLRDREDSPWYPTVRLFRQRSPGGWDEVLDRVQRELEVLIQIQAGAPLRLGGELLVGAIEEESLAR